MRFEKSFERFGGYQMFTYLCKKKIMERYFLSSDATPLEVRKLTTKVVIPREPVVAVVFKGVKPYENCLRVYDQEKGELHYYQPVDWVLSNSIFDSLRFLGYVPVGERYPYHKENQEQKAMARLEEIYKQLSSVWETPREPKEDITREELEQEVEKLISPFVGTPPLGFDVFGNIVSDPTMRRSFAPNFIPAQDWRLDLANGEDASAYSFFDRELKETISNELIADYVKNHLKSTSAVPEIRILKSATMAGRIRNRSKHTSESDAFILGYDTKSGKKHFDVGTAKRFIRFSEDEFIDLNDYCRKEGTIYDRLRGNGPDQINLEDYVHPESVRSVAFKEASNGRLKKLQDFRDYVMNLSVNPEISSKDLAEIISQESESKEKEQPEEKETNPFDIFGEDSLRKTVDEWLSSTSKEIELRDRFWVKSYQCPSKRVYMEQYEGKEYPFLHTTDVGEEVLLIPDEDNYFYLYFDFKHEQRFDEKRNGTMVDKDCHPFFKLSSTCAEHITDIEKFTSSRLKRLLSDDYIAVWNDSEFDVYPKSFTWKKSDYMSATWVPQQGWVTNIFKRHKK